MGVQCHVESHLDARDCVPDHHPQHRLVVDHCHAVLALIQRDSSCLNYKIFGTRQWISHWQQIDYLLLFYNFLLIIRSISLNAQK